MLELIHANKTEHPRFAILVCVKDWKPCPRIASPDKFGELVTQGADRVRMRDVDHVHLVIRLRREPRSGICEKQVKRSRAYDVVNCVTTP